MNIDIEKIRSLKVEEDEVLLVEVDNTFSRTIMKKVRFIFDRAFPSNKIILHPKGSIASVRVVKVEPGEELEEFDSVIHLGNLNGYGQVADQKVEALNTMIRDYNRRIGVKNITG